MGKRGPDKWLDRPRTQTILRAFSIPQMPKQVERELGIKKLKLVPFLSRNLIKCLNGGARKGRYYLITKKGAHVIHGHFSQKDTTLNWQLIGKIMVSPKQKLAVLLIIDEQERTSEEIRRKASTKNPCLSRISTKDILKWLVEQKLVNAYLIDRKRYYRISKDGVKIRNELPLSS